MAHYHPVQYEAEAQIRQREKMEQARQWRLAQTARPAAVRPERKGRPILSGLRALLLRPRSAHP